MHGISVPVVVNNMSSRVNQTNTPLFKAIDFFCGGGGMTCGLRQVGIDVIAGMDFDKNAQTERRSISQSCNYTCEVEICIHNFPTSADYLIIKR